MIAPHPHPGERREAEGSPHTGPRDSQGRNSDARWAGPASWGSRVLFLYNFNVQFLKIGIIFNFLLYIILMCMVT